MRSLRIIFLVVTFTVLLAGCGDRATHRARLHEFSTFIDVQLDNVKAEQADAAFAALKTHFANWHDHWTTQQPLSALAKVNQSLLATGKAQVPDVLIEHLKQAQTLSQQTRGLFAPASGELVQLWGFHDGKNLPKRPPSNQRIQALTQSHQPFHEWTWKDQTLIGKAKQSLDLGGYAKGAAIDEALVLLKDLGIEHALINAGGDLRAMGRRHHQHSKHTQKRPWRVGIRDPFSTGPFVTIELDEAQAVFTSGTYERYFEYNNQRYHHLLNPFSGQPANTLASATVVLKQGAHADAYATAIVAAGENWRAIVGLLKLKKWMVVTQDQSVFISDALNTHSWFPDDSPYVVTVMKHDATN